MKKDIEGVPIHEFIVICVMGLVLATIPLWLIWPFIR